MSLRGTTVESRRVGRDLLSTARQGGLTDGSTVLFGYMHLVDRWNDNALDDIEFWPY